MGITGNLRRLAILLGAATAIIVASVSTAAAAPAAAAPNDITVQSQTTDYFASDGSHAISGELTLIMVSGPNFFCFSGESTARFFSPDGSTSPDRADMDVAVSQFFVSENTRHAHGAGANGTVHTATDCVSTSAKTPVGAGATVTATFLDGAAITANATPIEGFPPL
ncbi:MAG: hypothetical protein ACJ73S_24150 [Mycobacteriales bacterium]